MLRVSNLIGFNSLKTINTDTSFSSVSLLLHMNGTDTSTSFIDSSSSAKTITANGNAQLDTTIVKFGSAAGLFDGTGDYLNTATAANLEFGTGDFTIEFWINFASFPSLSAIMNLGVGASGTEPILYTAWGIYYTAANGLAFYRFDGTETVVQRAWSPSTSTWYHVAIARSGTTMKFFVDGSQIGADISSSTNYNKVNEDDFRISYWRTGVGGSVDNYLNGSLDDIRITKGVARYTSNFTAPISQFPDS